MNDSIEEFAELSDLAVRLVTEAETFGEYNATVNYDSHEFSTRNPDELREEAPDLPLDVRPSNVVQLGEPSSGRLVAEGAVRSAPVIELQPAG